MAGEIIKAKTMAELIAIVKKHSMGKRIYVMVRTAAIHETGRPYIQHHAMEMEFIALIEQLQQKRGLFNQLNHIHLADYHVEVEVLEKSIFVG